MVKPVDTRRLPGAVKQASRVSSLERKVEERLESKRQQTSTHASRRLADVFVAPPAATNFEYLAAMLEVEPFRLVSGCQPIPSGALVVMEDFQYGQATALVEYQGKRHQVPKELLDLPKEMRSGKLQRYEGSSLSGQRSAIQRNPEDQKLTRDRIAVYEQLLIQDFFLNRNDQAIEAVVGDYAATARGKERVGDRTRLGNILKSLMFEESKLGLEAPDNVGQQTISSDEAQVASFMLFEPQAARASGIGAKFQDPNRIIALAQDTAREYRLTLDNLEGLVKLLHDSNWTHGVIPPDPSFFPEVLARMRPEQRLALACVLEQGPKAAAHLVDPSRPAPNPYMLLNRVNRLVYNGYELKLDPLVGQVRQTLAWLDHKYNGSWESAVRGYNGAGTAAENYKHRVMARVDSGKPVLSKKEDGLNLF